MGLLDLKRQLVNELYPRPSAVEAACSARAGREMPHVAGLKCARGSRAQPSSPGRWGNVVTEHKATLPPEKCSPTRAHLSVEEGMLRCARAVSGADE